MFFSTDNLLLSILDVFAFDQNNVNMYNKGRNFNALSFRIFADTQIYTNEDSFHITDNTLSFFPAFLDYKRVANRDKIIVVHFEILNNSFEKIEVLKPNQKVKFKKFFQQMLEYWNNKEDVYRYKTAAVFNTVLSECVKQVAEPIEEKNLVSKSVKFLETNFTNPQITIKEIAEKSHISEVYFRKIFKEIYGTSPIKYIIDLRLNYAIYLMQTGYYTLNEISALSGYEDYAYFSTEFKRHKGLSPSKFFK